ncbi:conserved hypothetical protein [Gammaproteobacteria bacterium]
MIHGLFNQKVYLDEIEHRYYNENKEEYISFSKLFGFLVEKSNFDMIAGFVAKKEGVSKEEVAAKWKAQTDEGTRIDKALELYAQTGQILKEDADLETVIKTVLDKYKVYKKTFEQVVVYNDGFRTAGSIDKLCLLSNLKNGKFHMNDFKCFEGGMQYAPKGQPWLNAPLSHLPNSKYVKICLQLSYYSWHYEKLTGMKCEAQFIDMIKPIKENGKVVGYSNTVIPCAYLKTDIEAMLNYYKPQIEAALGGVVAAF